MRKQQKKRENETKGLKFAKSVFFPDSRNDFKKKKLNSKVLKFEKKNWSNF
jgi:hypothetical protein